MNQRKLRAFCAGMLMTALLLRVLTAAGFTAAFGSAVKQTLKSPEFASGMLSLAVGQEVEPVSEPAAVTVYPLRVTHSSPPEPVLPEPPASAPSLPPFTQEEAAAITVSGACSYPVDRSSLLLRPSALDFSGEGPKILIVHTHSSEAYTQEAGFFYEESDELRTLDSGCSVIRIGSCIADILNEAGIETLHDTALNDYPNYSGAYDRMKATIDSYLAQYPSIRMVLDIHRDAAEDADGSPVALCSRVDGERCAQLMLVIGTDEGGLSHPGWEENLANALKLQAILNRDAPGLCRSIDLRTERFNQHETPGSMLVEFGATGNTLSEALLSAEIFAQALCEFVEALPFSPPQT